MCPERSRTAIVKQWAKRQEQIERVIDTTAGMYGDLQGLAGSTLRGINGFDLNALNLDDGNGSRKSVLIAFGVDNLAQYARPSED
jgi:hypothetical protein